MTETIFDVHFDFLVWLMSANMQGVGFMNYTVASQQGAIEMFWLHFWGAVMSSIFIYSL